MHRKLMFVRWKCPFFLGDRDAVLGWLVSRHWGELCKQPCDGSKQIRGRWERNYPPAMFHQCWLPMKPRPLLALWTPPWWRGTPRNKCRKRSVNSGGTWDNISTGFCTGVGFRVKSLGETLCLSHLSVFLTLSVWISLSDSLGFCLSICLSVYVCFLVWFWLCLFVCLTLLVILWLVVCLTDSLRLILWPGTTFRQAFVQEWGSELRAGVSHIVCLTLFICLILSVWFSLSYFVFLTDSVCLSLSDCLTVSQSDTVCGYVFPGDTQMSPLENYQL